MSLQNAMSSGVMGLFNVFICDGDEILKRQAGTVII